jgi:ABC-type lipoprotein release transport system permease subunit
MGKLGLVLPLAWRSLWRNPRRTLITLAVVAIGMWSILIFDVMFAAVESSSREQALRVLTGEGQIHAMGYVSDPNVSYRMAKPSGTLLAMLNSPAAEAWTARVRVPAIMQSEYETRPVTLTGVLPSGERRISDLPTSIVAGRYLKDDNDVGIVIGRDLAAKLKTRLGKRVIVMAQSKDGHLAQVGFVIVGIYGASLPTEDEFAFTGRTTSQTMLGVGSDISEISFDAKPENALDRLVASLRHAAPSLDIEPWTEFSPIAFALQSVSQTYTAVWLVIMFVLMAIGIVNTQLMAVFERTREFGLMQALGMRPVTVVVQVCVESALLVGLGVISGVALTALTLAPFRGGLDFGFLAAGIDRYGLGSVIYPQLDLAVAVLPALTVWILGILATLWPARRASHIEPVVAMAQL